MPVALLLQLVLVTVGRAARALAPWREIVPLEASILGRRRGAFLRTWFGPGVPLDGLTVSVGIANLGELVRRFHASPSAPNLLDPVLGFAGTLAGVMLSPAGMVTRTYALLNQAGFSLATVGQALLWLVVPLIAAALLAALVVPGAVGFALFDGPDAHAVFDVFGALARFMNATVVFLGELFGPREAIRNPLLKAIVGVVDQLAPLLAQILAALAVTVRRIGPVLPSLAHMLVTLGDLAGAALAALAEIFGGLFTALDKLGSFRPIFKRVAWAAEHTLRTVLDTILVLLEDLAGQLSGAASDLAGAMTGLVDQLTMIVRLRFTEHGVIRVISSLTQQLKLFIPAITAPSPSDPDSFIDSAGVDRFTNGLMAQIPPLPPFPALPDVPDEAKRAQIAQSLGVRDVPPLSWREIERTATQLGRERAPAEHLKLGPQTRAALDRSVALGSVLPKPPAPPEPPDARLRDALIDVVGRLLPPAMQNVYWPRLQTTLEKIDSRIYKSDKKWPVREPPADVALTPHITRLRLQAPGADRDAADRFRELLLTRLRARTYVGATS